MNQEKIGKFISRCRKNKNLTQSDIAKELGVTDRSVSNWENGKNMPDYSLLVPLCKILNISVNELLSGEILNKNNFKEKSEENIINTIKYNDKKLYKKNKVIKVFIIFVILILLIFITLFITDINRMKNNEQVFFSTWGFDYHPPVDLSEEKINRAIKTYIISDNEKNSQHYNNEKWFVSTQNYLIDEVSEKTTIVYSWVLAESYYYKNEEIKQASGYSIPHKFVLKKENDDYIVVSYEIPGDGSKYLDDIKKIFPLYVRIRMEDVHIDGTIERLMFDIEEQVNLYYKR